VIQKCLQVTDGFRFKAMVLEIKPMLKILKQTIHGKKIYDNLMKDYSKYFLSRVDRSSNK
jgi:hypothetical protein